MTTAKKSILIVFLIVVSVSLFRSCEKENELSKLNETLKFESKEHIAIADSILLENKVLTVKIDSLEKVKQTVIVKRVEVEKKTKEKAEKVPSLSKQEKAVVYEERYNEKVTITDNGIELPDSVTTKNIVELVQLDGCVEENSLLKKELVLEEQKVIKKDTIIKNYFNADVEMHKAAFKQRTIIENQEKSLKIESNKKTFWKLATGVAVGFATYILISK